MNQSSPVVTYSMTLKNYNPSIKNPVTQAVVRRWKRQFATHWDSELRWSGYWNVVMWNCRMPGCCRAIWRPKEENQKSTFFCKLLKPLIVRGKARAYWKLDEYKSTLICKWLKTLIVRGKAVASGKVDSYSQTLSLAHSFLTAKWSVLLWSSKIQCHVQIN